MSLPLQKCALCGMEVKLLAIHQKRRHANPVPSEKLDVPKEVFNVTPEWCKKVDEAINVITGVAKEVDELKKKLFPTATDQIQKAIDLVGIPANSVPLIQKQEGQTPEYKCHPRHRQLADEILGSQFLVWESYDGVPSTHFQFNIKVPDVISPLKGQMPDIRSKAVPNNEGENGVRDWLMKVRQNLNKYYAENALQSPFANVLQ